MKITNEYFEEAIKYEISKLNIQQELTEEDLNNVKEINLSNRTFAGKDKNIDLSDLKLLSNIKSIYLQYFLIDDYAITILNSLNKLENITFASCKFINKNTLEPSILNKLSIEYCDILDYATIVSVETFRILDSSKVRLEKISKKEKIVNLLLQNCDVRNFETVEECNRLKFLNLDGTKVDNKKVLKRLEGKIEISQKDKYLPIK